jgi:hypothetical protein
MGRAEAADLGADVPIINRDATAERPEESPNGVSEILPGKSAVQAVGEETLEIRFGSWWIGIRVPVGGSATGGLARNRMDATLKKGQLSVGPAQWMHQQSFSRMEGGELVD